MPPASWRERFGDRSPFFDPKLWQRGGRPVWTTAGPRQSFFSIPPHDPPPLPEADAAAPRRQTRSSSTSSCVEHKFPFRCSSRKPEPFDRWLTETRPAATRSTSSRSSSRRMSADAPQQCSGNGSFHVPHEAARPSLAVTSHDVESAVSARLDPVLEDPVNRMHPPSTVMRRVAHVGLRARYYDNGRKALAPARQPMSQGS